MMFWVDFNGNSWELVREVVCGEPISGAREFVLKNNFSGPFGPDGPDAPERGFFGGGALDWCISGGGFSVSAERVEIANNFCVSQGKDGVPSLRAEGGAICAGLVGGAAFSFRGCGEVSITDNVVGEYEAVTYTPGAGAIHVYDASRGDGGDASAENSVALEFIGNDNVYIRGNCAVLSAVENGNGCRFTLMAITTRNADVVFAADKGQNVECYDAMRVDGTLWINTSRSGASGGAGSYSGTVLFSGEHTEKDLNVVDFVGDWVPTEDDIAASRVIEAKRVHVQCGVLELNTMEMRVAAATGSKAEYLFNATAQAEVRMTDAAIVASRGAKVALPKASFSGCNVIQSNYVNAAKGTWTFSLNAEHASEAALRIYIDTQDGSDASLPLTLRGLDTSGATFCIKLEPELKKGLYKLLEFKGNADWWTGKESVTLSGVTSGSIGSDKVYYTVTTDVLTLWYDYDGTVNSGGSSSGSGDGGNGGSNNSGGNGGGGNSGSGNGSMTDPSSPEPPGMRPSTKLAWNVGTGVWKTGEETGPWQGEERENEAYCDGDSVVFRNAASVVIESAVYPAEVVVSHDTGQVLMTGNGQIAGDTKLIKTGLGELALSLDNTYTGGTEMDGGVIQVGRVQALGTGMVRMTGGELNLNGLAVQNDITATASVTIIGGEAFAGNLTLEHVTIQGEVSVGKKLSASNSVISGRVTLRSGATVQISGILSIAINGTLKTTDEQTIEGGLLELTGGSLALGGTLTLSALRTNAMPTTVQLDVEKLREAGEMDIFRADDLSGVDETLFTLAQLQSSRYELGRTDTTIWVKLKSADLTWQPGESGSWGSDDNGGEWGTDEEDRHFHDLDDVTFDSAGEVRISGTVEPGSIHVTGTGDTSFVGSGSIIGSGKLTKDGSGSLRLATNNKDYNGDIEVTGGTLFVGHEHALGNGAVRIHNAVFNGGGYKLPNDITFSGTSSMSGAEGASRVTFAGDAQVSGSYTLAVGNHLTVAAEGASFTVGSFTFAGGVLHLTGGAFRILADVHFAPNSITYQESLTTIDVSAWEGIRYGVSYALVNLTAGADVVDRFTITGLSEEMAKHATLMYENGTLVLLIERAGTKPEVTFTLSGNQVAVYDALDAIDREGKAQGTLAELIETLFSMEDEATVRSMLDRLSGEEYATAMTSQVEGNMAHLRRLRANMGSAQRLDAEGKYAAYLIGYDGQNHVDADAETPGMKRTEWGGMLGVEFCAREQSIVGIALTSGSAKVTPTRGESYDEDALRVDIYTISNFGQEWQSVLSLGFGKHEFSITRQLPGGYTATAAPEGYSVNFQGELSYTRQINDRNSIQPFISLAVSANVIPSFSESGAGSASLESKDCATSAVDFTLGARYIRSFTAAGRTGHAMVQAGIVHSAGDSTAEMELNFVGAPNRRFNVEAASVGSMGFNLGASVLYPITKHAAVTGSVNAILRSGSQESGASVGVRLSF